MCSDGHKLAQNPLGGDGGKGRFLYADELGKHLPLSSSSPPALFIKPISILKAERNPSVQRIFICLTQCFPNSRVLPSQNSDSPFTESPEGVNPALGRTRDTWLCPGRWALGGPGPSSRSCHPHRHSPPHGSAWASAQVLGFSASNSFLVPETKGPAGFPGPSPFPVTPQVGPEAGPPLGFGSPQEGGADRKAPTGESEQMAEGIIKIQLCSHLGRLGLKEGEAGGGGDHATLGVDFSATARTYTA